MTTTIDRTAPPSPPSTPQPSSQPTPSYKTNGKPPARTLALSDAAYAEADFPALHLARAARIVRRLGYAALAVLCVTVVAMVFAPWQQSIRGEGQIIAFDPFERPQPVQAPVKGLIAERADNVQENAYVKKGDLLFVIQDQAADYLTILEQQLIAAENEVRNAEARQREAENFKTNSEQTVRFEEEALSAMETAGIEIIEAYDRFVKQAENKFAAEENKLVAAKAKRFQAEADYQRKKSLFEDGIETELKFQEAEQKYRDAEAKVAIAMEDVKSANNGVEGKKRERESKRQEWQSKVNKLQSQLEKARGEVRKAQIAINKTTEEINQKRAKALDQQRKVDAQLTQYVKAPRDGYIQNLAVFEGANVKPGQELCRIVPRTERPAVEMWVDGNDAPLIGEKRHVRLQFEGWPAVQLVGWPSVAVGTFGGEVALVDATDNGAGKFRIVVTPDPEATGIHEWPEYPYLRQGVRANGWVLLEQVPLGYEVWRRMNGFPPALKDKPKDEKTAKPPKVKI